MIMKYRNIKLFDPELIEHITFSQVEESELQRLVRKITYNQPTIYDMKRADELTSKKWKSQGIGKNTLKEQIIRDLAKEIISKMSEEDFLKLFSVQIESNRGLYYDQTEVEVKLIIK